MNRWLAASVCLLIFGMPALAQTTGKPGNPFLIKKKKPEDEKEKLKRFLTKDFQLAAPVEVRNEERGFGIFFGTTWRIEPDGRWSSTRIYLNKPRLRGTGKLTKDQLKKLALVLVAADPLSLPNVGRQLVNPHVLSVSFGSRTAVMVFGVDQRVRPVLPGQTITDTAGRYSAIETAVRGLIDPHIGPEPPLPRRLR